MAKYSAVAYLMAFIALLITDPTIASAESEKSESEVTDLVERFLRAAPVGEIRKLKNEATATRAAAELTKHFQKSAINKRVVLHIKVRVVETDINGADAFRIGPEVVPVKWADGTMELLSWFYFPAANVPELKDVKAGSEITVAGIVRRCEIVVTQEGLRFDFDLWKSKIENRK